MSSHAAVSASPPGEPGTRGLHIVPVWEYVVVYLALIGFTAATALIAFVDLGPFNNVVAVGIAITKAVLVILFFMHVKWSPRLIPLVAAAGFFWLIHLIAGTLGDYFTRGVLGFPGK
ncbi:MAG: cytochrome C oxidase subunit IV family protein [Polyangiaceae bacterium]